MILVVTLLLLAVVLVFVGYPLMRPAAPEPVEPAPAPALGQRERLLAEREHALSTLKELEFEHSIGNLSAEDYASLQAPQRRKAVAILRELDAADADRDDALSPSPAAVDDRTLDVQLEAEIARERARLAGGQGLSGTPVVSARQAGPTGDAGPSPLCPICHTSHAAGARFCAECGHKLRDEDRDSHDGIGRTGRARGSHEG